MGKYVILQSKRLWRLLLWAVPTMALLLLCLGVGGGAMIRLQQDQKESQRYSLGMVGVPDSGMLRLGLSAIESVDDLGYAVELVELTPQEAPQALASGQVDAYVVLPEGFVDAANHGQLLTIDYVTTADASGLSTMFQKELTAIVGQILLQSEKASFGSYDALQPYVGHEAANKAVNDLSIQLAQFLLVRGRTGRTVVLGLGGAPSFGVYMACGLGVTMLLMIALSFGPMTVQQHLGVNILLRARGRSDLLQALVDYAMIALGVCAVSATLLMAVKTLFPALSLKLLVCALPVALLAAALAYLCFSLMSELLSALLCYFFTAAGLALVGGCMYPVWFFPESIQRLAAWLPTGLARQFLTDCLAGRFRPGILLGLGGYTLLFAGLGMAARMGRVRAVEEKRL